ncbi:MAG: Lysine methyltransferase [Planctomycetota bacterium]|jgi:predicted nicotinamide N-methyase
MDGTQRYPWPGGLRLAADLPAWLDPRGQTAVDLGTGTGVVARALLDLGAARVWALDAEPAVAFADPRLTVAVHRWGEPVPVQAALVLGGDVTYRPERFPALLATVRDLLLPEGTAWLADPRSRVEDDLPTLAAAAGLTLDLEARPGPYTRLRLRHRR